MSDKKPAVKVGQSLCWVSAYPRDHITRGEQVLVTKVGRVWITLSNDIRVDKVDWEAEEDYLGRPPGKLYPTMQAFMDERKLQRDREMIVEQVRTTRDRLDPGSIKAILAVLEAIWFKGT